MTVAVNESEGAGQARGRVIVGGKSVGIGEDGATVEGMEVVGVGGGICVGKTRLFCC